MFRPDFNSTTESIGNVIFDGQNTYDARFFYFNNSNFSVWPFANGVGSIFIPYTYNGKYRGSIGMPMGNSREATNAELISRFTHRWKMCL